MTDQRALLRVPARPARASGGAAGSRAVLLVGFEGLEVDALAELLGPAATPVAVPTAEAAGLRLAAGPGTVLCVGPQVRGAAARDLVARAVAGGSDPVVLVLAAARLDLFDRLVHEDRLFYLSAEPPPLAAVAELLSSALERGHGTEPGDEPTPRARQRATEVVERLRHESDLEVVARLVAHVLPSFLDADRGACWVYEERTDSVRYGPAETGGVRRESAAAGLVSFVLRTGRPIRADRVGEDPRYDPDLDNPDGRAGERFLAVPVPAAAGGALAVLSVVRGRNRPAFGGRDEADLRHLARRLGPLLGLIVDGAAAGPADAELFRAQALEHQGRGEAQPGRPLDLSPRWMRLTYRLLVAFLAAALVFAAVGSVDEYASGRAVVRADPEPAVVAAFPGRHAPAIAPGVALRLELDGYPASTQWLEAASVGEGVIGPEEARRLLGADLAGALEVRGPAVLVHAPLPAATFESGGRPYAFHHGMSGTVEVRLGPRRILGLLVPGLDGWLAAADD